MRLVATMDNNGASRDCVNLMLQGFPLGILTIREYSILLRGGWVGMGGLKSSIPYYSIIFKI
eukprot:SAG31_NODE_42420_length_271_cov_1.604651_1_plen_62_part_00